MRREAFGALAALSDADLARALVGVAASSFRVRESMSFEALAKTYPESFGQRTRVGREPVLDVTLPLVALQRYATLPAKRKEASQALTLWRNLFPAGLRALTRYCLELKGARSDPALRLDLQWLLSLLGNKSLNPVSAFAAWPSERTTLEWDWPLRIGIAPGAGAAEMRRMTQSSDYRELFVIVDLQQPGARCDVLLCSSNLKDSVRSALDLHTARASAVLVLGGLDASWTDASTWMTGLRRQLHAGAVATCFVPSNERGGWFQAFIQAFSHNSTLDEALFAASGVRNRPDAASGRTVLALPLLLADREFLNRTPLADTAKRIASATAATASKVRVGLPDRWGGGRGTPLEVARKVTSIADQVTWQRETQDATTLRRFREDVERATGTSLVLPGIALGLPQARPSARGAREAPPERPAAPAPEARPGVAPRRAPRTARAGRRPIRSTGPAVGAEPPARMGARAKPPAARPAQRHVQLDVFRSSGGPRQTEVEPLASYRTDVFISPERRGTVQSDEPLDESRLAPSSAGHEIRIVFTPLWKDAQGAIPPAQTLDMHLPAVGASEVAQFNFTTPKDLTSFRARLVLLNQFRVLQTLLLHCPHQPGMPAGALRLTEENIVSGDYGQDTLAPPFEAALIVNDSPQGVTGLTTIASGGAQFFEPAGLDVLLKQIRDDLGLLNAPEEETDEVITGLDDERVHDLMFRLALRGAGLAKELKRQPQLGPFLSASRLQVIDAVSGAFFPIELVYDGKAPMEGAKRCERSIEALDKQSVHDDCPNRKSSDYFCPAAFWGFWKCIERQPSNGQMGYGFSQPAPGNNTLRPLRSVLFGASRKVRQLDIVAPQGLESVFTTASMSYGLAKTWPDWTTQIGASTPSMLVLLPHSLRSAAAADLPALETGGRSALRYRWTRRTSTERERSARWSCCSGAARRWRTSRSSASFASSGSTEPR